MEIIRHKSSTAPSTFKLRDSFLEIYYHMGDPFKTLLARSTYLSKYCRDGEEWTDTIRRVVEGNISLAPNASEKEAEMLFHACWTGQAFPPGRGLWTGGVEGIPADARYNCFAGETSFWAGGVLTTLRDVVGSTVEVLTKNGKWLPAEVHSFGVQKLYRYRFTVPGPSKYVMEFNATKNHRWFTDNRGEVTDLSVGDRVVVTPSTVDRDTEDFKAGYVHGLIFGDGSVSTGRPSQFQIRLCGDKSKHLTSLEASGLHHNTCWPPSYNGDPIVFLRSSSNLKNTPEDTTSLEYQAGFLQGWLDCDGSLRENRKKGGLRLGSQNALAVQWLEERAPLLGFCVTGYSVESNATNYGPRSAPLVTLTLRPEPVSYQVFEIIDEGREEEVFCVVEPETHSFTLSQGVPTGNCWGVTLRSIDDWCWVMNQLMLGGGVGVGLNSIERLGSVSNNPSRFAVWCKEGHENFSEVKVDPRAFLNGQTPVYRVPDSREGWVEALRLVLTSAFEGRDFIVDVSDVRPRGRPIRTFGGIACGPGPLTMLLRRVWEIARGAAGRRLSSVECLDITNLIGFCVKSGNVRRSALIVLGDAEDQPFRDAKKDFDAVLSHRHTSNNSLFFYSDDQIARFNWAEMVEDNITYGEPGLLNLALIRKTDPNATCINPCGEIPLHDREACNLAEAFPAFFDGSIPEDRIFQLLTRYCLRQRLSPLLDLESDNVRQKNMRLGVGLGGLCDFDWTGPQLAAWYAVCRQEANDYADALGVERPNAVTTVKPSGTISLLNTSSPGIHAPYAPYYIRRARLAVNDPLVPALREAGVECELDGYDKTGNTLVFSFPMKASHTRITVQTETIVDQFERQAKVQEWWSDNAVSATLSFNPATEKELTAQLLAQYVPKFKSTSLLAKEAHGYPQAPYEAISEDTYREMCSTVREDHPLIRGGDVEIEECANGVCPIR